MATTGVACCLMAAMAGSAQTLIGTRTFGGSGSDVPSAIASDADGNIYIAGSTTSPDFPVTKGLYSQLPEPSLRVSIDGRVFLGASLAAVGVNSVAVSSDGSLVLAGATTGLYASRDGGKTWSESTAIAGKALAVAIDPSNATNAYAVVVATSVMATPASPENVTSWTIYKSTDGGVTWPASTPFTLTPTTALVSRIGIDPLTPSNVYAYVNSALMRSVDAGASWQPINIPAAAAPAGFTNPTGFAIAPSQPSVAYATTFYTPLMKTTDGGDTWQAEAQIQSAGENAIALDPTNASVVWLVNGAGIHRSTDGGATFSQVTTVGDGDGSWRSIAISNADSSHLFASDLHNVYATFDGGSTWSIVASGQINAVFAPANGIYVAASVSPTVFLAKLDPTLTQILFSTFVGAGSVSKMALDSTGNVFLAGSTQSHAFPSTATALGQSFASGSAGFLTKVRADGGALLYSTLLDGLPPNGIALDQTGDAVVVGAAAGNVPVTANAFQPTSPGPCTRKPSSSGLPGSPPVQIPTHAFAAKLNADASAYLYLTYVTGSCGDAANDVALDSSGSAWIGGTTYSLDFPVTAGALQSTFPNQYNSGFIAQLSPAGDRLPYATFFGGSDQATVSAVALDLQGNVVAAGTSIVQGTAGAYQSAVGGCPPVIGFFSVYGFNGHGFVLKFSPGASAPIFTAVLGGVCADSISHMTIDSAGDIWVAGLTSSSNFPTIAPFAGLGATYGTTGFVSALNPTGTNLISSSIAASGGAIAAGPAATVAYAEPIIQTSKNADAILAARIDASRQPPILLDSVGYFGSGPQLAPVYVPSAIVAPGQVVRLNGRGIGPSQIAYALSSPSHVLPTIAGVQVTFNGIAAPLVSVQASQIVCIAPFELDGLTSATLQIAYSGQTSNTITVGVAPQNIDIYAVVNPDGTLNSALNPAPVNGVVALFMTGLGQTNPPSTDGTLNNSSAVPQNVPVISVNGTVEQPLYFGAAVGEVAGAMQANIFVPNPGASVNDAVYVNSTFVRIWAH